MSRSTQPYRKGPRQPGQALDAMLAGRAKGQLNSADIARGASLMATARKVLKRPRRGRVPRKPRPRR